MAFLILGVYFSPSGAVSSSNTQVEKEKKKKTILSDLQNTLIFLSFYQKDEKQTDHFVI